MNTMSRCPRLFSTTARPLTSGVVLAIISLAIPAIALGDIAPDPLSGGVNFSGSTDKVEMSEESVTLDVTATQCTTHALFHMKNLTKAPVTMEVGFPYAYARDLQDFRVTVDGQAVKDLSVKRQGKRRLWKVWTMTFPPDKVTKVEVDYWNEIQSKYSWTSFGSGLSGTHSVPRLLLSFTHYKTKPKEQTTDEELRQFNELSARLQHGNVRYIMTTGAGWAGNIGKCRIEAKFHEFTSDSLITRFPYSNKKHQFRDPKVEQKGLVWELADFEPKNDIFFQVSPHFTHSELKDLIEETLKDYPHNPKLTLLLGGYCKSRLEQERYQKKVDDMLAVWATRLSIDGPDYVDRKHAQQSFEVWFAIRKLTITRSPEKQPLSTPRLKKLLPTIKTIATRMQAQLPKTATRTKRLNEYQVKTFRRESDLVLKWVEEQK